MPTKTARSLYLFLCGDVMTGRGIDQLLPHPGDPGLHESYVSDAREYLRLAEKVHGPISRPATSEFIWGDALGELRNEQVDLRIINLEASVTESSEYWKSKSVHYRMHPQNIGCLHAAHIDACTLANNHILDWGYGGLKETLHTLDRAALARTGAGKDENEAEMPTVLDVPGKGRVLLFSYGSTTSGIPAEWAATKTRPGVNIIADLSEASARQVAKRMRLIKRRGDVAIASIHWGGNWGYWIPTEQKVFAHCLIDEGFDLIHGHSSHHAKAFEVYRDHLVLYGCGDFLTDYEGITGYEEFRGDLHLMYFPEIDPGDGRLAALRMIPLQTRKLQLRHATDADAAWLQSLFNQIGKPFGTEVERDSDNVLHLAGIRKGFR